MLGRDVLHVLCKRLPTRAGWLSYLQMSTLAERGMVLNFFITVLQVNVSRAWYGSELLYTTQPYQSVVWFSSSL
ncbi:hypothetical protein RRG08_042362 [Elysia crispata]|uniref:Uncharacterized protein n=1 Tax=Elysia crispata TaxID=231223 RepID=A0AAE0ZBY6_9GAST|nr:hypothetical protein RRG08_042362 [Elysia crispata]KAK3766582.1 hypothetical protein RRG08_042362 [Elysia crispata]